MLGDPDFLGLLVDNSELVGVLVLGIGTGRRFEEVQEEVSIDHIQGWDRGNSKYVRGR